VLDRLRLVTSPGQETTPPHRRQRSVPEAPYTCEHHGDSALVTEIDGLLISYRATRLDYRLHAGVYEHLWAVREGEKLFLKWIGEGRSHREAQSMLRKWNESLSSPLGEKALQNILDK